jgi:hypothetical protein
MIAASSPLGTRLRVSAREINVGTSGCSVTRQMGRCAAYAPRADSFSPRKNGERGKTTELPKNATERLMSTIGVATASVATTARMRSWLLVLRRTRGRKRDQARGVKKSTGL